MGNPFHGALDDNLRGRRVQVQAANGRRYKGWMDRLHHKQRHVLLRDAVDIDDDRDLGAVMVAHADTIAVLEDDSEIQRVPVADLQPAPYHARELAQATLEYEYEDGSPERIPNELRDCGALGYQAYWKRTGYPADVTLGGDSNVE
jgi:hypothetical protein